MFINASEFDSYTKKLYMERNKPSYTASAANIVASEAISQEIEKEETIINKYQKELRTTLQEKAKKELQEKINNHKEKRQALIQFKQKLFNIYICIDSPENAQLNNEFFELRTAIDDVKNQNENERQNTKLGNVFSKEYSKNKNYQEQKLEELINDLEKFLKNHHSIERALNPEIQKIITEARTQTRRPHRTSEINDNEQEFVLEDERLKVINEYNRLQGKYEFKTTKNFNPAKAVVKGKEVIEKLIQEENLLEQIDKAIKMIDKNRYPKTFDMLVKMQNDTRKEKINLNKQLDNIDFEQLQAQVKEAKHQENEARKHQAQLDQYANISYQLEKLKSENPNDRERIAQLTKELNSITGLEENEKRAQKFAGEQKYANEKLDKKINQEIETEEKNQKKELEQMAYEELRRRAIEELGEKGLERDEVMLNGDLRHTGLTAEEKIKEKMQEIKERDQRKEFVKQKQDEIISVLVKEDFRKNNINEEIRPEDLEVKREELEQLQNLTTDQIALRRVQEEGYLQGADLANLKPFERDALEAQKRIDNDYLRSLKAFKALKKEYDILTSQERNQIVSEAAMEQYMGRSEGVSR